MLSDIEDTLKYITRIVLALLSLITALAFLEGIQAFSFNIYALLAFCIVWCASSALIEEIESEGKKLLLSLGVPASLAAIGIMVLQLTLA